MEVVGLNPKSGHTKDSMGGGCVMSAAVTAAGNRSNLFSQSRCFRLKTLKRGRSLIFYTSRQTNNSSELIVFALNLGVVGGGLFCLELTDPSTAEPNN